VTGPPDRRVPGPDGLPECPDRRATPLDLTFAGFPEAGLDALARLKAEPHIGRYREEKAVLKAGVEAPFRLYRDDLALNWAIPNGLPFETEKGVFSRLLKNDFGAGGSHHHLWMSFYRTGRKRLTDIQLSHAVYPDGFRWALYAGDYSGALFRAARERTVEDPEGLRLINALIAQGYRLAFAPHVTKPEGYPEVSEPLSALPAGFERAKGIWLSRRISRAALLALGPDLVSAGIDAQLELWPLYRFWAEAE
jgi:hypothetical protein